MIKKCIKHTITTYKRITIYNLENTLDQICFLKKL